MTLEGWAFFAFHRLLWGDGRFQEWGFKTHIPGRADCCQRNFEGEWMCNVIWKTLAERKSLR